MNWTESTKPTCNISFYDHVICQTPLGVAKIEWKGWKESDSYELMIGNEYIGFGDSLEYAKQMAVEYLSKKHKELSEFLAI